MPTYKSTTRIAYGHDGDGKVQYFEKGDKVTGLDKETMKQLWDNGALMEVGSDEDKEKQSDGAADTGSGTGTDGKGPVGTANQDPTKSK